jgi:hypothetical protein
MTGDVASSGARSGFGELDAALDRVIVAAREHLEAVKAADGEPDDEAVWNAYVTLNNASHDYDELLNDVFGEVTPWDVEAISPEQAQDGRLPSVVTSGEAADLGSDDPYPHIVSVRQRRDYRIPSVSALLRAAEAGRAPAAEGPAAEGPAAEGEVLEPVGTVGEALLELMQSGDGSLAMLDVPELDPLDGVVVVAEVGTPLRPEAHEESDGEAPFRMVGPDRMLVRLDERTLSDFDR